MEILKATNLSKIYQTGENAVYALNDVTLSLEEGSFVAITGPSGSGKSTLLHLLSGLDKPTHGSVLYRDKELYQYNDNQLSVLRRRRFGFVFQSYNLVKEIITRHHGTITAENGELGLRMTISMPMLDRNLTKS